MAKGGYPEMKNGDTVIMECDIYAQTISFTVNDDQNVAKCGGIDFSKIYRMAIELCDNKDAVKLMSFKRWNSAQK